MRLFKKKGSIVLPGGERVSNFASLGEIDVTVAQFERLGRKHCLDIGSSEVPSDIYQHVNFNNSPGVDFYGDIRCCFSPGYIEQIDKYPDLKNIPKGVFKLIRLVDIVEHVEWIHQPLLFAWVYSLLAEGGVVYIKTPNLDYIAKMYLRGMQAAVTGKKLTNFPFSDHPDLGTSYVDIVKWVNSALFSGCSNFANSDGVMRGDYHHACFNKFWIEQLLTSGESGGFVNIQIFDEERLIVLAQKSNKDVGDVDGAVERLVG